MFDVPVITSPKHVDCGATCLKMLLEFYGEEVSLETLIKECNTDIIGCTARNIVEAGRMHGLNLKAYQMNTEELIHQDRPAIIWWNNSHFCIFCGRDAYGRIWVINPDRGRFRMEQYDFDAIYTNIALFNGEPDNIDNNTF